MQGSDEVFSASEVLQIISPFFETEWPNTREKDVTVTRVMGGFVNTLHLVSRNNLALHEPSSVLLRRFGQTDEVEEPSSSSASLSATEQAIVCYETGRRGWGPRLYGTFSGGRVEEFVDSHTLTSAESTMPGIRQDIARSYARLHSLKFPFRRQGHKQTVNEMVKSLMKRDVLVKKLWEMAQSSPLKTLAETIEATNWASELEWVSDLFIKHGCKVAVTHGDANYLNILVKDFQSACRVMLIDYETVAYNYRGIDIGSHFWERQYSWSNPTSYLSGHLPADVDEQRSFCTSYLREMQVLGQQLNANDTVEHLLMEGHIGILYQMLFSISLCFQEGEPEDLTWAGTPAGLIHIMEQYGHMKNHFIGAYTT